MTAVGRRLTVLGAAAAAIAVVVAGCGNQDPGPTPGVESLRTTTDSSTPAGTSTSPARIARTADERAFLDELSGVGFPTDMTGDTTVEVGIGICQSIAEGVDTSTILDHLHPFTSAVAAQHADGDTTEVGRAIVDASRTHLCD